MRRPNSASLPTEIVTVDLATKAEVSTRRINWANPNHQRWLRQHMFWAHYNDKGVVFNPVIS